MIWIQCWVHIRKRNVPIPNRIPVLLCHARDQSHRSIQSWKIYLFLFKSTPKIGAYIHIFPFFSDNDSNSGVRVSSLFGEEKRSKKDYTRSDMIGYKPRKKNDWFFARKWRSEGGLSWSLRSLCMAAVYAIGRSFPFWREPLLLLTILLLDRYLVPVISLL